jgi:dephospho-CoA kinase
MSGRFKVGVTGGIGSGKSTVCRVFSVIGIPVFSADDEARVIMDSEEDVRKQVNQLAGSDMYKAGTLNRVEMARLIFNNREMLMGMNRIIHPVITRRFMKWKEKQDAPYVIFEAAILFETGTSKLLDKVITVTAPVDERIERVVKRNSLTREQVMERINNQSDDQVKISLSDYVISNCENDMIIPVILRIHEELLKLANNR